MKKNIFFLLIFCAAFTKIHSQVRLPSLFSDSMVLQQKSKVPFWGWAPEGKKVSVTGNWPGGQASTVVDKTGKWKLKLQTPAAGGPFDITITVNRKSIVLHNILIGEVWVCAGQSNMEMPLSGFTNDPVNQSESEIKNAHYPNIRFFNVERKIAFLPDSDVNGRWKACSPATAADFSATAYFFGRELYKQLDVPIGLIVASWGGTVAEAWTSSSTLKKMVDFDLGLKTVDQYAENFIAMKAKDSLNALVWKKALQTDYSGILNDDSFSTWKKMQVPSVWESHGLNMDGIVWFKKQVEIPQNWAGKNLILELGPIDDKDLTYFNGKPVDSTLQDGAWQLNRKYNIPANLVFTGKNTLAVKVIDEGGGGGVHGKPNQLKLYQKNGMDTIFLSGNWYFKVATVKPPASGTTNPNQPAVLFNGMIAPLIPYAIKGAIWYQGESNVGRARQYEKLFPLMVSDWRNLWNEPDFPFYFVQIAPFRNGGNGLASAALRDAQRRTLSKLSNTGMAVTLDIGDLDNIHPANKQDVGKRLSKWALNKTYGVSDISYSGPLFKSFSADGGKITVSFTHTEGGLTSKDKSLTGFEVLDRNGRWYPAEAEIDGDNVIVQSFSVSVPIGIRYAFSDTAEATLFNGGGLPASSFTSVELR